MAYSAVQSSSSPGARDTDDDKSGLHSTVATRPIKPKDPLDEVDPEVTAVALISVTSTVTYGEVVARTIFGGAVRQWVLLPWPTVERFK